MTLSLMMTFASCALFAQAKDTIPKDGTPKTDTSTQKKDTMPSASATFELTQKTNLINFLKDNPADNQIMKNKDVSSKNKLPFSLEWLFVLLGRIPNCRVGALLVGGGDPVSKRDQGGLPRLVSPPTGDRMAICFNMLS